MSDRNDFALAGMASEHVAKKLKHSKRLTNAKEECADLFSRAAVKFETVIEANYDEWIADAQTKPTGLAEIVKPKVGYLREDIADVNKTDRVKDPE